ncbi:long-chain-fatty-acid--CoA ligase [uncultured Sphingomonas sp.]|uniref:long-chain-fatty-acid--CoA ligase n=1 Tax=uncultured Sphingomonas sp. TaxID=158754 RepID=UPI0035CC7F84
MYITQGLHRTAQLHPDRLATIFGDRRRRWSEIIDRVGRLAHGLVALGIERGDRVAVVALNSDLYLEVYYAVAWVGAVIVPGNTRWSMPEHIFAMQDSGASFLFIGGNFANIVEPILQNVAVSATIFMEEGEVPSGMLGYENIISAHEPINDASGHNHDLVALFYTGGTTGRAKGVMLSHHSLMSNILSSQATTPLAPGLVYLHSPPMFHLGDAAMVYTVTMLAGTHVIVPSFSPENVITAIERERVTDAILMPTMLGMMREYMIKHGGDLSSVVTLAYGASAISETALNQAMELFPNAAFKQAYGQTELSPCATLLLPEHHRTQPNGKSYLRSAGRAILGVDLRIVDENWKDLPLGTVGEVVVRSDGIMLGYWHLPEETATTLVDGWLRTGDAGYMDDEGFLYLVDRVKDMIVSGGENVYSAEVENALAAHPAILENAVIGVPDEKWGERVHAIIRLREGVTITSEAVIAHCKAFISTYKCPRSVEFREMPLPLSAQGKVLKTELRKPHWKGTSRAIA